MKTQNRIDEVQLKDALALKYIAHYKGEYRNSLFFDSNSKQNLIIFPGANSLILNHLSVAYQNERLQTFIPMMPNSKGLVTICQSPNKRYLAWSEQTQKYPVIFLIDLTTMRKKTIVVSQIKSTKYISLTMNGTQTIESKYLLGLTNGPQAQILQWNFEKGKYYIHNLDRMDKYIQQKYMKIFYFRDDDIIIMGKNNLKIYKLTIDKLIIKDSPFARREINEKDYNFISYCIIKDGLIIGTDNGELLYFTSNGQFKSIIMTSPGQNYLIQTIVYMPTNRSFIIGGSDNLLAIYEKSQSKQPKNIYVRSDRIFYLNQYKGHITSLLLTQKQDELFIGLQNGMILKSLLDKNEQQRCQYALQSFHNDLITGLDVCLRKSLVVTSSLDRSIKIWNYLERHNIQIQKKLEQKPLTVAFHPSGLHLIVSFNDRIRLMNILENDIVPYKDISIKNCYEIKFSNGGHLFAIINNVMMQIFNFYTLNQYPHYQFKVQTGRIQTITWQDDDNALYLGTSDGHVYFYKWQDYKQDNPIIRQVILNVPNFSVKTIFCHFIGKDEKLGLINERIVYIGGSYNSSIELQNRCIYQIKIIPRSDKDRQINRELNDKIYHISAPIKIFTHCNVSNIILFHSKKIFMYTTEHKDKLSTIRYCRYPFNLTKEIYQIQSHRSLINKIAITFDDNYVFSVGSDGQFICYQFKDKENKIKLQTPDLSQQFLYSKTSLIEQKKELENLKQYNNQAKQRKDKQLRQNKADNDRLIQEWNFKINQLEKSQRDKYNYQIEEISKMQHQHAKKMINLESEHRKKRETVEKDYADKLQLEQTRYTQLGKNKENEYRKLEEIQKAKKNNHIKTKEQKIGEFKAELERESEEVKKYQKIAEQMKARYIQEQEDIENEAQRHIGIKKEQNEVSIKQLKDLNNKAESEKMLKKNQYEQEQKILKKKEHLLKHTLQQIEKIKQKHEQNEQKKHSQSKQIEQRDKTIKDKITRINQLKKKTQELQKFKFVLDYKIKELKRDIGPREDEIAKMKQQIANMNAEIVHFRRTNDNMNLIVKDLVSKRNGMQKEINQLANIETLNINYIKSFQYDISDMCQNSINEYKQLKNKMIEIHRKYVQEDNRKKMQGIDQQKEFIKQRAHLQSTVKGLKQKFKKAIDLNQADNKRIMSQNEQLTSQINDLKRQRKALKDQNKKIQIMKANAAKLEEQRVIVEREYENLEKTKMQLKIEYERKMKRNNQGLNV